MIQLHLRCFCLF